MSNAQKISWHDRTRHYAPHAIERRVEEITLTCLEGLMESYNAQLKDAGVHDMQLLTIAHMMPQADSNQSRIQHGFYPVVQQIVTNTLCYASSLGLHGKDRECLLRLNRAINDRVDPVTQARELLEHFPQLKHLPHSGSAQDLYSDIHREVDAMLEEYISNAPKKPLLPPPAPPQTRQAER